MAALRNVQVRSRERGGMGFSRAGRWSWRGSGTNGTQGMAGGQRATLQFLTGRRVGHAGMPHTGGGGAWGDGC